MPALMLAAAKSVWQRLSRSDRPQAIIRALQLVLALSIGGAITADDADQPVARQLEAHARDVVMRVAASDARDPRLAIVDIDEASLAKIGPWPWPREVLAELAERLVADEGAAVVAFDIVLSTPSSTADGRVGDARLVALAGLGRLVPAQAFDYVRREAGIESGALGGSRGRRAAASSAAATGYIAGFDALASARCVGNIGFVPDADGKVRRIAPWTRWGEARYPAFAIAALECARERLDTDTLAAGLAVDRAGAWSVPFLRQPESYLAVSAADVLERPASTPAPGASAALQRSLAGRIVLVGSSALGLADRVATPLSPNVSGVTVHAAALTALLDVAQGKALRAPPGWAMTAWSACSILALWLAVIGGRLRAMSVVLVVTLVAWAGLAAWMTLASVPDATTSVLWGYASILLLHLPIEWSWAHQRVRRRTQLLSRYVAKAVLDELLVTRGEDPLAPRHAEITVLIADMQDYTRLTSHSTLEEAANLTRGFLEQLTGPVLAHRGTLDRYTGDGLVSFWGAPVRDDDHSDRALDAAFAIVENIRRFNDERRPAGLAPVNVRIGIASGHALVGDLGTRFRIAYTAVGDCINLASRLQQLSRELQVDIAVSSSAARRCRRWRLESLGTVSVRGLPDEQVFTPLRATDDRPDPRPAATGPRDCG